MGLRFGCAVLAMVAVAVPARADTFGGFSGIDAPYLINQDRVCSPLPVTAGTATGEPTCAKAAADQIAQLSIKPPAVERGTKVTFAATASGRTLTVTNAAGDPVVTWTASDPIGKVVEVYKTKYDDRVAVAYTVRRLGKEVTAVVAFVLVATTGTTAPPTTKPNPTTITTTTTPPPVEDPNVTKAVAAARKAPKAKALAAWQHVLALEAGHGEAMFRIAALQAGAKQTGDAIATLAKLAASSRSDAIEWLVEARFDAAFAAVRADPTFRAAVGLDRKGATAYERLMGFGGQWEQTATCGERPEMQLTTQRDRTFKLRLKISCNGEHLEATYRGTWRLDGNGQVVVRLPPAPGQPASAKDEATCAFEKAGVADEEALHCDLGHDVEFVVLPTRR